MFTVGISRMNRPRVPAADDIQRRGIRGGADTDKADMTLVLATATLPVFFQNPIEQLLTVIKIRALEPL